ncbi:MAG: hypothetical protein GEU99_08700 [Luteitalea sp.]|nr:hypothetical protein [Luteitalea sp.]
MTRAARTLLTGLIDYAGLFPPAGLSMDEAVERYGVFCSGPQAWLLGRFVVPLDHLERFETATTRILPRGAGAVPWPVSVLGSADPSRDVARVHAFNDRHAGRADLGAAHIDVVEVKTARLADITRARPFVAAGLTCFCEVPIDDQLEALVNAARAAGAGVKVRTGGVVLDAFPSSAALAHVIVTCAAGRARMKATAGLHHAVRGPHRLTYDAESTTTITPGFLNLFLAAAFAWDAISRGHDPQQIREDVERILDLDDPRLLVVDDQRVAWADAVALRVDRIELARRRFAVAFGSCSFEEPIEELQALGWI